MWQHHYYYHSFHFLTENTKSEELCGNFEPTWLVLVRQFPSFPLTLSFPSPPSPFLSLPPPLPLLVKRAHETGEKEVCWRMRTRRSLYPLFWGVGLTSRPRPHSSGAGDPPSTPASTNPGEATGVSEGPTKTTTPSPLFYFLISFPF